jgi:predicted nucleic acid-binding protein
MRKKIIVDTSVWIQFLNGVPSKEVDYLKEAILVGELVYVCPTIIQEVLQGIRDDKQYEVVKDYLLAFDRLEWEPVAAGIAAADLYRALRKKGITIRKSNDCLIAAFAKEFGLSVLQVDRDFQLIAEAGAISIV